MRKCQERSSADIAIRLRGKNYLKKELLKIAKRNKISMNTLTINLIDWFLEEVKKSDFSIKLK